MRIVLSCCALLYLALSSRVLCQTSSIVIGEISGHPAIYNRTFEIAAATRPWYKSMVSFFTRSEKPVQNVNYTFPPSYHLNISRCLIKGIRVFDVDRFGKGGLAKIVDGGLNEDHVTVNFISKPGESMVSKVIINGYCVQNHPIQSHAHNAQHANPINYREPVAVIPPTYGWISPSSNASFNDSSSVLIQNITSPSNSSGWWHFW